MATPMVCHICQRIVRNTAPATGVVAECWYCHYVFAYSPNHVTKPISGYTPSGA